jgi:glucosamine--fructose-6-phosphate aminotransferase (isomerizing)
MSGINGCAGNRQVLSPLLESLRRLQHRGYDSSGIATIQSGRIDRCRAVGKLINLQRLLDSKPLAGHIGIGHTRWATHGRPSERNAHPHLDCTGDIAVIHNGIVENFMDLRPELEAEGHRFASEADTEVIAHLVERYLNQNTELATAVRFALRQIEGDHALVVMSSREPDKLIAARVGCAGGIVIGLGDGETFVASEVQALPRYIQRIVRLHSQELAIITAGGARFMRLEDGRPIGKTVETVRWMPRRRNGMHSLQ